MEYRLEPEVGTQVGPRLETPGENQVKTQVEGDNKNLTLLFSVVRQREKKGGKGCLIKLLRD